MICDTDASEYQAAKPRRLGYDGRMREEHPTVRRLVTAHWRWVLLLMAMFLGAIPPVAREEAQDPPGTPPPESDARMVHEWVHLTRLPSGRIHVQVDYLFDGDFSAGRTLAFPETEWFPLLDFRAWLNDRPLTVRKEAPPPGATFRLGAHDFTALYVYDTPPIPGRLHYVRNSYTYTPPPHGPGTKVNTDAPVGVYVEYVLVTGGPWRADIGKVEVVFDPGGFDCAKIVALPDGYQGRCVDGLWRFEATALEPDRNIRLVLRGE